MAPCGTTLATFLWVAPEFCFRVLVQHGLTERITHIAMFFPLTLSHYGSRRHSVRAAVRRQLSERRARSDAPYHVSKFVCHSTSVFVARFAVGLRGLLRPIGLTDGPGNELGHL